jgi:hypothetical protein
VHKNTAPNYNYLTISKFLTRQLHKKKIGNEILFQKLFGSSTCTRITLINTKEGLISRTLTILVQKQFSTPHKAHNLTDGGRGGRKSLEQHNQYDTQQLAQIKKIKIHKIRNKLTPKVL